MNGGTLALMIAGLVGFGAGAYLAATGERPVGIALMGMGLLFQALTLRQLRISKVKDQGDAG
ncbi:hypothetical protein CD351_10550 [Erythrobacter sp. KY5]|uniref:hypothetical protein n=1 Tax=Erythrobacter sp. KY5 TaxID=2011159 RepID=UPI000DBF296E|nr:hypothetical protein [Erythrobacter sp. KY5]AWW74863.1 hypothetical protein CD351_10550 [Erythrobacter sp. KY5]